MYQNGPSELAQQLLKQLQEHGFQFVVDALAEACEVESNLHLGRWDDVNTADMWAIRADAVGDLK